MTEAKLIRSVWLLPGENGQHLVTLNRILQQAAFERGAAPITLIDGQKLLDLLMDHQIGVVKRTVEYYDFDGTKLQQFESESAVDTL